MIRDPREVRWIAANHVTRLPRRHIVFDTEAHQVAADGVKTQTFRVACAAYDHQRKAGEAWQPTEREQFADPESLWRWVDARTERGKRLVVVAHNLAYDLRVGRAFEVLPALGWQVKLIRLDGGSAWCQWERDRRSLCMVDSVSWFGCSLDRLGQLLRMPKLALPAETAPDDVWLARCATDVEILRVGWRQVLDWVERADLGCWKPTGAGQGWAFFRHRHLTHRILHHGHEKVAAVERAAAFTGRVEAWRHGRLPRGVWTEWDTTAAYAHVALDCEVPVRLVSHLGPRGAQKALEALRPGSALLRCQVTQEAPVAPYRGSGGILWPSGSFESWLWDVEAAEVVRAGGTVEAVEGYRYATAPALRQWARWVLDVLDAESSPSTAAAQLVVKGWSRTTVGRFGSQWATWDDFGEARGDDVRVWAVGDGIPGRSRRAMMIGGRCLMESERRDAPDGAPQVMSFVMAQCRVNLWRAMTTAGLGHVAYVDTDGLIVDSAGSANLAAAALPHLRVKSRWESVRVLGPRQIVLRGELRAAGVPRTAVQVSRDRWSAEVWRSLAASLRQGETDRVVVRDRTFTLTGKDRRRGHLPGGVTSTLPVIV